MFLVAWYWNLRNEMCCITKYFQEHYNTVYHGAQRTFLLFTEQYYTRYFLNARRHQVKVKAIVIGISKDNTLAKISWLLWCVHLHMFFFKKPQNKYKELSPNTYFYIAF